MSKECGESHKLATEWCGNGDLAVSNCPLRGNRVTDNSFHSTRDVEKSGSFEASRVASANKHTLYIHHSPLGITHNLIDCQRALGVTSYFSHREREWKRKSMESRDEEYRALPYTNTTCMSL